MGTSHQWLRMESQEPNRTMPNSYIELTTGQVAFAVALIAINLAVSIVLQLKLARSLIIASARTVVQLLVMGHLLQFVFSTRSVWGVATIAAGMTLIAGGAAAGRSKRHYPGMRSNALVSVAVSAWAITGLALMVILRMRQPWQFPEYTIPLLGMVLGNTLNGISLALQTFTETLLQRKDQVQGLLALGATRWEAARECIQQALRTGLLPLVNSMSVVGLVSLPGMMTGQLLSGTSPASAIKYQIVIMFLIASATALGATIVVLLSYRRLFTRDHRFLIDAIVPHA